MDHPKTIRSSVRLVPNALGFMNAVRSAWKTGFSVTYQEFGQLCGIPIDAKSLATQPELPGVTILEVRRPRSTGHILQKGGTPSCCLGQFPEHLDFPDASFDGIYNARLFHFFTGDRIRASLAKSLDG